MYPSKLYRIKLFLKSKLFQRSITINNNINFGSKIANNYFFQSLKTSKFYFEYGSGSSSLLANKLKKNFISIESDFKFYNYMRYKKKLHSIKYYNIGPTLNYSYPLFIFKKKIINYVSSFNFCMKQKKSLDLILIDGRFRIACCLNLLNFRKDLLRNKTKIILDDYFNREHYQILNLYFKIKKIGRFAVLIPKIHKNFRKDLKHYLNDPR